MLDSLMDSTEKKMVFIMARKEVEGAHANGDLEGTVDQNFSSPDPRLDPNLPGPRDHLTKYQRWVLFGVKSCYTESHELVKTV